MTRSGLHKIAGLGHLVGKIKLTVSKGGMTGTDWKPIAIIHVKHYDGLDQLASVEIAKNGQIVNLQ